MKIYIASDHAGFDYKKELIPFIESLRVEVIDCGADKLNEEDDYPEFIGKAAREVSKDQSNAKGIILGGSGQGEAMLANRFKGVRAAVYNTDNLDLIRLSREHNDANILSIGARFVTLEQAKEAIKLWLEAPFSKQEKYARRIAQAEKYP